DENIGILLHAHDRDDFPVFLGCLQVDDAFAATALRAVFLNVGALSKTAFRHRKHHVVLIAGRDHAHDVIAFIETNADDAVRLPAHLTNVCVLEPDTHAVMRSDESGLAARHELGGNEFIIVRNTHRDDAAHTRI